MNTSFTHAAMNTATHRLCARADWRSWATWSKNPVSLTMALALAMIAAVPAVVAQQNPADGRRSVETEPNLIARYLLQEDTLQMQGYASGSFLGIGVVDVTAEMAEMLKMRAPRGVAVTAVTQGSPADKAGLRMKDVLVSYNGTALEGSKQLMRMVEETPAGRVVRLEVLRNGQPMELGLTTAARRVVATAAPVASVHPASTTRVVMNVPDVPKLVSVYSSGSIGVDTEALGPQLASYFGVKAGALVREVTENSPAEKAGVRAGDVIIYLGERSVTKPGDLNRILSERENATGRLKLGVVRHQQEIILHVTPAASTAAAPQIEGNKSYPRSPRGIPISSKH